MVAGEYGVVAMNEGIGKKGTRSTKVTDKRMAWFEGNGKEGSNLGKLCENFGQDQTKVGLVKMI